MAHTPRKVVVNFQDTVSASSVKVLASAQISVPFTTKTIRAAFAPGANRLLRLYYFISNDSDTTAEIPTSGNNLLAQGGGNRYLVGDDNEFTIPVEVIEESRGKYIKIAADNTDTFEHTIDTQIIIETMPEGFGHDEVVPEE